MKAALRYALRDFLFLSVEKTSSTMMVAKMRIADAAHRSKKSD
jgi:hypothetical protein